MEQHEVVRIESLTKVFKGNIGVPPVTALKGISFTVNQGEVFGLLGPNGSGKTTTIKILLNLLFPTTGKCRIFGMPPSDIEVKRRIGFLPEESYLYRFLNARETLDFFGALSGIPKAERRERAEELIERVGLSEAEKRPLRWYSKGMSRRIGLAAALIGDPEFIILDEPTSGLDPIGTREIKDLIIELKEAGKTVLLSSHLLADVEDVCNRIAILSRGEVAALGPVSGLLARTDRFELVLRALSDAEIADLKNYCASRGAEVLNARHPRRKLEDLFLEVVSEHGRDASDRSNS